MRTISDRLREERDATGLSQQALADRCGISLRSQQNYEKGDRSPDAEYLAQLTAQSIDVLYILTGSRSANSFSLDAGERVLIDSYRRCGEQARRNLLQTAALLGAGMAGNSQDSAQISVSAAGGYAAGRDMAINTPTRKKKVSDTQKIDSPHGHAAGRDMQIEAAPELSVRTINGGTNIIGNHGNVSVLIGTQRKAPVRNVVQPGPEHISAEQRRMLFDLCDEWVTLHNSIKKNELLKAVAWSRINKAAGSTSYHLILRDRFDDACALVRKEMAILRGMRSAPLKDPAWRSKRIAAIKVRSTKQLGDPDAYKAYIRKNFKLDSLADLSTDQLQRTYAYIMAKKISE